VMEGFSGCLDNRGRCGRCPVFSSAPTDRKM
jgi:hypothetical protein